MRQSTQTQLNDEESKPSSSETTPGFATVQTVKDYIPADQLNEPETPAGGLEANSEAKALEGLPKSRDKDNGKHVTTLSISYVAIGILLVIVVSMLLLLYFFYNVMSEQNPLDTTI